MLHVYDFILDKVLVFDERVNEANTATTIILGGIWEMMKANGKEISANYADVPGQLQIDLKELHDYDVIVPPKDDWKSACNNMDVGFIEDRILIHPRCTFLIENCNSGTFNKLRTDFSRSKALGHCDGLAALLYGFRTQDKQNPWPARENRVSSDLYFIPPKQDDDLRNIAKVMQPRTFGKNRM